MTFELKVRQIGNSLGVIIPKEALVKLGAGENDTLYLNEGPEGYKISIDNPSRDRVMRAADDIFKRYPNALRELAK